MLRTTFIFWSWIHVFKSSIQRLRWSPVLNFPPHASNYYASEYSSSRIRDIRQLAPNASSEIDFDTAKPTPSS